MYVTQSAVPHFGHAPLFYPGIVVVRLFTMPLADEVGRQACICHVDAFMTMQSVMIFSHLPNLIIIVSNRNNNNKTGESCPHTHSKN